MVARSDGDNVIYTLAFSFCVFTIVRLRSPGRTETISFANCLFIFDEEIVVVNSGDSRTIGSKNRGDVADEMSIDHKPGALSEFTRIIKNGGQLYRVSSNMKTIENMFYTVTKYSDVKQLDKVEKTTKNLCFGPWRIKPGGLSVSR